LLEKKHPQISQRRQAALLGVARSSAAYEPVPEREEDRQVIRIMDELYLKAPSLGSRPLVTLLERDHEILINRKRVQRLRRAMGLEAIWCRPRTTVPDRSQRKYPYLLRDLKIDRANQVWCTDFTYVPMPVGHAYLCAVMDWHTRKVLGWTVSNTMDTELCLNALQQALTLTGTKPEIFNCLRCAPPCGQPGGWLSPCGRLGSGKPVHLGGMDRAADGLGHCHQHGWQRPVDGQRVHRAALAQREIRGDLPEGARHPDRVAGRLEGLVQAI
jgi:putative transposase